MKIFYLKNISKLESMVNQIKKNSKDIRSFLNDFQEFNLFQKPCSNSNDNLVNCKVCRFFLWTFLTIIKFQIFPFNFLGILWVRRVKKTSRYYWTFEKVQIDRSSHHQSWGACVWNEYFLLSKNVFLLFVLGKRNL